MTYRTKAVPDHPLIGQSVKFDAQPYHRGTMVITSIEEVVEAPSYCAKPGALVVIGMSEDSTETSRLFQHTSTRERGPTEYKLAHYSQEQVERCIAEGQPLIYVYPV